MFVKPILYVTCDPTVQTRLVPIQVHFWNLRRQFPVDILNWYEAFRNYSF